MKETQLVFGSWSLTGSSYMFHFHAVMVLPLQSCLKLQREKMGFPATAAGSSVRQTQA